MKDRITPLGVTNYRNIELRFGIKDKDRLQHVYVIGKSGTGKSTLMENMVISDIQRGHGLCLLDPHGDIANAILRHVPKGRLNSLIYIDAANNGEIGLNPLKDIHPKYHHLVASGIISTFKKIWADSWGPRMEHILRYSVLTLLHVPNSTLLDIQPLLTDINVREKALQHVDEEYILNFWKREFDRYTPTMKAEVISPILNKIGLFHTSIPLQRVFGQNRNCLKLRQLMDSGKIFVVNLSKGLIGEDASSLLGAMLINSVQLAALHRANIPERDRRPFYLYIDECHSFVTLSFANILAEARKYGLSLTLAHQYIEQLDERVRHAIFGNVGTLVVFRVGAEDAECLEAELFPTFNKYDIVHLPRFAMYLKLMIDGAASAPFSAVSLPPRTGTDLQVC